MSTFGPQKSTIDRVRNTESRAAFRLADLIAPRVIGRRAREIWFTVPPPMAPTPLPPDGEAFTVTSQGADIHGHVFGAGPVVYLVHGWGGRASQLASFVAPLVASGHRVVLFDAPAHGDSPHGPAGPGRSHGVEFAKALDAVFARFGPAEVVIAHSLGVIATYLSLRYGWLGTKRLVLIAPMVQALSLFDQFQTSLGFGDRSRRAFEREADALVGLPMAEFDALVQASYVDPVPTLVVHDESDRQTPYADAERLARGLPDAELVTTQGLGHRRILDDPEVIAGVVDFVCSGDSAASADEQMAPPAHIRRRTAVTLPRIVA